MSVLEARFYFKWQLLLEMASQKNAYVDREKERWIDAFIYIYANAHSDTDTNIDIDLDSVSLQRYACTLRTPSFKLQA